MLGLRSVVPDKVPMSDSPRRNSDASPTSKGPELPSQSSPAVTVEVTHPVSSAATAAAATADSTGRKSVSQIIAGWSPKTASGSPSVSVARTWPPVSTSTTTSSATAASAASSTPIAMIHHVDVSPSPLPSSIANSFGGDAVLHRDDSIVFAPLHNQNNSGGNKSSTHYPPPQPTKYLPPPSPVTTQTKSIVMDTTEETKYLPPPSPVTTQMKTIDMNTTDESDVIPQGSSDIIPLSIQTEQDEILMSMATTSQVSAYEATEDDIPAASTTIANVIASPPLASPFSPSRDNATRSYSPDPLPAGWTEHLDLTSGHVYYANGATGESQWDVPTVPPPPASYYPPPPPAATYSPSKSTITKPSPSPTTPNKSRSWLGSLLSGGSKNPLNSPKK